MHPQLLRAFRDELEKIATAGDLMTPAVVSDSATVDGPPATPFTRRKGFKKLEQTLPKEAGILKGKVDVRRIMQQAGRIPSVVKGKAIRAGKVVQEVAKDPKKFPAAMALTMNKVPGAISFVEDAAKNPAGTFRGV